MDVMDRIRQTHSPGCGCSVCRYENEPNHVSKLTKNELDKIKKVLHDNGYEIVKEPNEKNIPPPPEHHIGHD